jgi:hypothetical protein
MGVAVVSAVAALVYFAGNVGNSDRLHGNVARAAQATSAPPQAAHSPDEGYATMVSSNSGRPPWVSTHERVLRHEALPCTGPTDPVNFEVFSAGPAVAGAPMTAAVRRCDAGALADESTSNYLAYIYGECQSQSQNGAGCLPPLQIRSYPACQRSYAEYSFEGKPLPYRELPSIEGAKVFEIEFLVDHRIEVYTGASTIVLSAADWPLAEEALEQLRSQPPGTPPATAASSLARAPRGSLEPPVKEALEGDLPCQV